MSNAVKEDTQDEFEAAFNEAVSRRESKAPATIKADAEPEQEPEESQSAEPPQSEAQPSEIEALKRQLADALHRERSSANRISSFARESNSLREQVAELQAEIKALRERAVAMQPEEDDDSLSDAPELKQALDRKLARVISPMQQELDATKEKLRQTQERAAQAAQAIEPLVNKAQEAEVEQIFSALDAEFHGWRDEVKTERFQHWLASKSPAIQHLYHNGTTLGESREVLDLYRSQTGSMRPSASATKTPEQIAAARAAQLRASAGIRSGIASNQTQRRSGDEFGDAFEEFAAQRRARRNAAPHARG